MKTTTTEYTEVRIGELEPTVEHGIKLKDKPAILIQYQNGGKYITLTDVYQQSVSMPREHLQEIIEALVNASED